MNNQIYKELQKFIADELGGEPLDNIKADTRMDTDLKIYGDDADKFISAYTNKFEVDLSDFDISLYFRPEGDTIFPFILKKIGIYKPKKQKELRVIDLYNGIINKKLI